MARDEGQAMDCVKKDFCLLVLGGEIRDMELFRQRLESAARVYVADSGARHLTRIGLIPERIYGDLDSLSADEIRRFERAGCRFTVCPAEKNDTDGVIVLREALREGYKDIRIWGALGGRPDHAYANILLLRFPMSPEYAAVSGADFAAFRDPGDKMTKAGSCDNVEHGDNNDEDNNNEIDIVIEDRGLRIFLAKKNAWIDGKAGEYLSLFALSPEVTGFRQKGLKYQPDGDRFISEFPLGISNEFTADRVWMDWDSGVLLCMRVDGGAYDDF